MTLPFAAISPSEPRLGATGGAARTGLWRTEASANQRLQRTEGAARIAFKHTRGGTHIDRLFQSGAAKVRLPRVPADDAPEAVLINTAGGLTGGDSMSAEITLGACCRAVVTTQACEKIYRAPYGSAEIRTGVVVSEGARLDWLPQETILFDGARLARRLHADLAPGAELLAVEAVIFGRAARAERVRSGLFSDRWRIRRGDRLVFADDLRFDWADADLLSRPAVLAGGSAMATILFVTGEPERYLSPAREIVGEAGGVSAWDGKLLARLVAANGFALRQTLIPLLAALREGAPLPKLWRI